MTTAAEKKTTAAAKTVEDRAYSSTACETLNELVADVAYFERWEDEGVAVASNSRTLGLACANRRNDGGIGLKLTVNLKLRTEFLGDCSCLDYIIDHLVLGRTLGRE